MDAHRAQDAKAGALCVSAYLPCSTSNCFVEDALETLVVSQSSAIERGSKAASRREAGIRVDLQNPWLPGAVGAEIHACIASQVELVPTSRRQRAQLAQQQRVGRGKVEQTWCMS